MIRPAQPAVALLALGLALLAWWLPNRPAALPNPYGGSIASVSFAPYRGLQSPLTAHFPSAADIAEALTRLAGKVQSIRLYTAQEGMETVPPLARSLGLKVIAAAWLGRLAATNRLELDSVIGLANAYPDTIERVLVGNEVLLRQDLTPDQLIAAIRQVRAAIRQPVSYADVWEFWLKHPEVAREVDFITIHILPYWEDEPLAVPLGNAHVDDILAQIRAAFPGKPVLIGELGWPSHGRDREGAVAGRREAATFLANFLNKAAVDQLDYNLIEAFDQPWKTRLEGTVGGTWGLFDSQWRPKYDLAGAVSPAPWWPWGALVAAAVILAGLLLGRRDLAVLSPARVVLAALALALVGIAVSHAVVEAALFAKMIWPRLFAWSQVLLCGALGLAVMTGAVRLLRARPEPPGPARRGRGEGLLALSLVAALTASWLVILDGRYRDFPTVYYGLAAVTPWLLASLAVLAGRGRFVDRLALGQVFGSGPPETPVLRLLCLLLALALLGGIPTLLISEGGQNREALVWAGLMLAMIGPFFAALWRSRAGWSPYPPAR